MNKTFNSVKKIATLYASKKFIIVFTRELGWSRHVSVAFSPRPAPFKLVWISSLLCPCLTTDFFLFRLWTQLLYTIRFYPVRTTFSTHLILLDFITLIIFSRKQKLRSSSSYNFFSLPSLPLSYVHIVILSSRFLNTLNIIYFPRVKTHNVNTQHSKSYDVLTAVSNETTVFKCDTVYFGKYQRSGNCYLELENKRVYFSTLNMKAPGFEER
jgi:hypothetical protein